MTAPPVQSGKPTRQQIVSRVRQRLPNAKAEELAAVVRRVEQRLLGTQETRVSEQPLTVVAPEPSGPGAFVRGAAKAVPEILQGLFQYGIDIATTATGLGSPLATPEPSPLKKAAHLAVAPVVSAFQAGQQAGEAAFFPAQVSAEEAGRRATMLLAFVAPAAGRALPARVRARVTSAAQELAAKQGEVLTPVSTKGFEVTGIRPMPIAPEGPGFWQQVNPSIRDVIVERAPRIIGEEARKTPQNGVVDAAELDVPASVPSAAKAAAIEATKVDMPTPSTLGVQGAGDISSLPTVNDLVVKAKQVGQAERTQRGEAGVARIPPPKVSVYKSVDPQVEGFFTETARPATRSTKFLDDLGGKLRDTFVLFNRLRTSRTNPGSELFDTFFADAREVARQGFDARRLGASEAVDLLHYTTGTLDRAGLDVFRRMVVLRDLVNTAGRGITLPRGLQLGQLQAELGRLEAVVQQQPALQGALQRHVETMGTITTELVQRGVLDAQAAAANPHYFPHQVLDYLESQHARGGGKLRKLFRGYAKERKGSLKDIYTDYLEVLYGHFAKVLRDNRIDDVVQRVAQGYDVQARPFPGRAEQLVQTLVEYQQGTRPLDVGQQMPKTLRDLPDTALEEAGYARYYYAMPRAFYQARTVSESAITRLLEDIAHDPDLAASGIANMRYFKEALAVGRGPSAILPKELGEVLEGYRDQYFVDPSGFVTSMTRGFKQLVLNVKPARYNRRNLIGDAERVNAGMPTAFAAAARALKDEIRVLRGSKEPLETFTMPDGTVRTRYELANERAVIASGRTGIEVGRVRELEEFQRFLDSRRGDLLKHPVRTFNHALRRISQSREDWLRLASFYKNLDNLERGKPLEYGISNPRIIDAIADPVDRAAKISRELLGDYGGLTRLENGWRNGLVPFYAWLKINSTFWPALIARQGLGGFARGSLTAGARNAAWLTSRVAFIYATTQVWNNTVMGEQEDSLAPYLRRQFHLNTGMKDEEGRWITLTDPTALDDFLQTVGLDGASPEMRQVFQGQLTMGEWLERRSQDMLRGPARAVLTMLGPVATVPLAAAGKQLFPDPFNPRDIPPYNRIPDMMRQFGVPPEIIDFGERGTLPDPQRLLPDVLPVSPLGVSATKPTEEPALVQEATQRVGQLEAYIRDLEGRQASLLGGLSMPNATVEEREAEVERLERILRGQYEKLDRAALKEIQARERASRRTARTPGLR